MGVANGCSAQQGGVLLSLQVQRCPQLDIWGGHKEAQVAVNANYGKRGRRIIYQRRERTGRLYRQPT